MLNTKICELCDGISSWSEEAQYRIDNEERLKASVSISIKIFKHLRKENKNILFLANEIGISNERIREMLSGKEEIDAILLSLK